MLSFRKGEGHHMKQKIQCIQCGSVDEYSDENFWWDDHGYGYSTKLVRCNCGQINIVKYQVDKWLFEQEDYVSKEENMVE